MAASAPPTGPPTLRERLQMVKDLLPLREFHFRTPPHAPNTSTDLDWNNQHLL